MKTPNIILILTDHFRRDVLGASTPNLLQLAAQGARFTNAYCMAPLCQPSRVSLITGMYPSQHGVCGNQSPPIHDDLRDNTFMRHLQQSGYYTALIGKHHYIDSYGIGKDVTNDNEELKRYGFEHVFQVADDGENLHNEDEYTRYLREKDLYKSFREAVDNGAFAGTHPFAEDDTADGFIGVNGVRFVEEYNGEQPFYLNLGFIGPHPPFWHPGELQHKPGDMPPPVGAPDNEHTRKQRARYMEKCALIDRYVGRLVEALEKKGLRENTVIMFTSDHGDCLGDFGIWDKRYFYEGSAGIPFILGGPGIPKQERLNGPLLSKLLVSHADVYPTILRLAGIKPKPDRRRRGKDLLAMMRSDEGISREAVFAELATMMMVRTANWKLVFDPEQGGVRYLFNMAVDPEEEHNLAGVAGYEQVVSDLIQRLLAERIRRTQFSHAKEEQRLQQVRTLS